MSDELKIVNFSRGGRPIEVLDLEEIDLDIAGNIAKVRDSFRVTPPTASNSESVGLRRWSGSRIVGQKHSNASVGARWKVTGTTAQEALTNVELLLDKVRHARPGRYIKWRPEGAPNPTYFEIRGPGEWTPDYRYIEFSQLYNVYVDASWPVAPLGEMDRMDIYDEFSVPDDAQALMTNLTTNPRAGVDLTGIAGASAGVTLARITSSVPSGFLTGVEATGTAVAATSGVAVSYGRSGTGLGVSAQPVVAGKTYAVRVTAEIVSISSGGITNLNGRVYWYTSAGAASSTVSTTFQAQSSPVIGTDYNFSGIVVAPSDAYFGVVRVLTTQTNPSTWVIRSSGAMLVEVDAGETVVPAYFDGDSPDAAWSGIRHASESTLYDRATFDDYQAVTGAGLAHVGGNALRQSATGEKMLVHTARGYSYSDAQHTLKIRIGVDTAVSSAVALVLKYLDADNFIYVRTSSGSGLHLRHQLDGVDSALATVASSGFTAGGEVWLRGRFEGDNVYAELYFTEPTPSDTSGTSTSVVTLTGTAQQRFGSEVALPGAIRFTSTADLDYSVERYMVEPYTYKNIGLPRIFSCLEIPGSDEAPALLDVYFTQLEGATQPTWAMLGWWEKPRSYNLVWNGSFEDDVLGWSVSAVSGVHGAATSITRVTTAGAAKFGVAAAEIVTPATSDTGASFHLYGLFRKGVTYTAELWARSAAQTTNAKIELGVSGDLAGGTVAALSSTHQRYTVTWTPTADRNEAYVAFTINAATATTMQIDAVQVYDGTDVPTLWTQTEGRGALPPIGIIPAEACYNDPGTNPVGFAITTDATNYRGGFGLQVTTSGQGSGLAEWIVDPSLLVPEDFTLDEIDIEIYARIRLASTVVTPRFILSGRPTVGTTYGPDRWTNEWGTQGRLVTVPTATASRLVRLGTLSFTVERHWPARWRIRMSVSWGAGSSGIVGIDQMMLVPVTARAISGPTNKPAGSGSYPGFLGSAFETTRLLRSDGSGATSKPNKGFYPAIGMSRDLMLPSGDANSLFVLSSLVPDDPTASGTSEAKDYSGTVHFAVIPRVHLGRAD